MDENIIVMNKYTELCYASVWSLVYKHSKLYVNICSLCSIQSCAV